MQQRIGHSAHGGDDDADALIGIIEQKARHASKTVRIPEAAATELMNFPGRVAHLFAMYTEFTERKIEHIKGKWWGVFQTRYRALAGFRSHRTIEMTGVLQIR